LAAPFIEAVCAPKLGLTAAVALAFRVYPAVRVSYADLDIHSEAGAKVLYSRLKRASEEVCGIQSHVINGSLAATKNARACYREALEVSVKKIDSDALTGIHTG
jgi:UrcA family protein